MSELEQKYISIDGYRHISTVSDEAITKIEKIRKGELVPLLTSIKKENDAIGGLFPGDQAVLAGRTGTGKSAKAIHDLKDYFDESINPFYKDKLIGLYDSYEMQPWRNITRMLSRQSSKTVQQILSYKQALEEEEFEKLKLIRETLKGLPIYFSNMPKKVEDWFEMKKNIMALHPDKYFINIIDHTRLLLTSNESSEEAKITRLANAGIRLKQLTSCINIFVSQMNRNIETSSKREEIGKHTPVSSDIFGSDGLFQAADVVSALHRPGMYGLTTFEGIPTGKDPNDPDASDNLLISCVLKNRDGWTGNLSLKHNLALNKFEDYNIERSNNDIFTHE